MSVLLKTSHVQMIHTVRILLAATRASVALDLFRMETYVQV